jgi:3-(3-hydroxy-phenyl)propionate hydroxylase
MTTNVRLSHDFTHPVAVVGNGPVGQTTALLLARWGISVVVLDGRAARDAVGSKAICQQRDALDIWESVGAGAAIAREGVTWRTARTFFRDEELFAQDLGTEADWALPPFVNISQARTEELLDERIAASPLVEVLWNHDVVQISQNAGGVRLGCETPAGTVDVEAAYAVVCAGARSDDLRTQLGVGFEGHSFDDRFLICDIRTELPHWADERRFYFDPVWNPGRQVLIHPCPGSTFRIDWQVPAEYDLAGEEADGRLDTRIRSVIGDRSYEIVWKSVYRFQSRLVDRMRVGRVLLAGDSAHLVSPFGARGLNSGVADAENAAWKLAYVIHGWAPDRLLETYHDERHEAAQENIEVTTATMDFLVPQTKALRRRRLSTLMRASTDDAARRAVDSGRLAEPYWYVSSPLTTADPSRPFLGRPERGCVPAPGPGILVPDAPISVGGQQQRFRRLTRDGLLLLLAPDCDSYVIRAALREMDGPVRVVELDAIDGSGGLVSHLGARASEVWVVRPDAYVAAVLESPSHPELLSAVRHAVAAV